MPDLSPSYTLKGGRHFRGKNIMTPNIEGYGLAGKYIFEVSNGPDPWECGKRIYGLTVKDALTGETDNDLSDCYSDYADMENAITELKRIFK